MERLLILGGTYFQVPAIKYAKSQGYYVITCDYIPNNPGHRYADEFHNVSTTNKEEVLKLAKVLNVNGILCFASDPAAPTAAYVSEKLGLPGNSFERISRFAEKHLWRTFLKEHGFNTPKAKSYTSFKNVVLSDWSYPVMVKPIDSSGSKGVTKVNHPNEMQEAFEYALTYSRAKNIIIEEFIERVGPQIGGDGFYGIDKLDFVCFGDQVVDSSINPYVPCGMQFPANINGEMAFRIKTEIERVIKASGLRNLSFNLEVMVDKNNRIFLMEIGPRNGGNCIPEVIQEYTGVNMVALAVEAAMGKTLTIKENKDSFFHAYYALHSTKEGIYHGYKVNSSFRGEITGAYIFLNKGDIIGIFNGSNQTIGIILLKFINREDMEMFFKTPDQFIQSIVE